MNFDYGKSFNPKDRLDHNDKSIEKTHRKANDNYRDKNKEKYGTGYWINLLYQTPPYDIMAGSKELEINMGGKAHRMYTLGHDPILGWIFGTVNILTDCITFNNFHTNRVRRIDPLTGRKKMIITQEIVPMGLMFRECYEIVRNFNDRAKGRITGKELLEAAIRQVQSLQYQAGGMVAIRTA